MHKSKNWVTIFKFKDYFYNIIWPEKNVGSDSRLIRTNEIGFSDGSQIGPYLNDTNLPITSFKNISQQLFYNVD